MPDAPVFRQPPNDEPPLIDLSAEPVDATSYPDADGPALLPRQPPSGPSRRRMIVLGSVLAISLAGAAALGTSWWRIVGQKDATLRTPSQVAGLTLDDSEAARDTADYLRTALTAEIDIDQSVGAVYTKPGATDRSVLLVGGTALIWQPNRDLERLFELVTDDGTAIAGLREVPAGKFGGVMKCATSPIPEGDLTVCGWADHGSVALALFPGRDINESAGLLREIRGIVQSRN